MQHFDIIRLCRLILILALIQGAGALTARHIVGGEIFYECTGAGSAPDTRNYQLTMKIYRDCAGFGASFDNPAQIGVYSYINGVYAFVRMLTVNHGSVQRLNTTENPCLILPPNVCVEETSYIINLANLPIINGSYFISWQRCCRNNTISNLVRPEDTGATYTIEITDEAQRTCNKGPRFNSFPPIGICVNEAFNFDHSASDAEGDQIIYEFCAPLQGGGPLGVDNPNQVTLCNGIIPDPRNCPPPYNDVIFAAPTYSSANPLGTTSPLSINPTNGFITGVPTLTGQFVVGVCVKEYRNGILLSVLRRDFQFNVVTCQTTVSAVVAADTTLNGKEFIINSCGNNTVSFRNESQIEQFIRNYRWSFDINGSQVEATTRHAAFTFPGIGNYRGQMIINEGEQCGDTAYINVNVYPALTADFEFDYDTCIGGPVSFRDRSVTQGQTITGWDWEFGDGDQGTVRNPNHLYKIPGVHPVRLITKDNNQCRDTVVQEISYFPVPPLILIQPNTFKACVPESIRFTNLSVPIDESYDIRWDFGDGGVGSDISPLHNFEQVGVFTVKVEITSPIGCYTSEVFPNLITIEASPTAGFLMTPETLNNINPVASFTDQSQDATGWYWDFGGRSSSFIRSPTHTFRDTGIHKITQIVFHPNGCSDTSIQIIDIEPIVQFFLPNAFTPNSDGKNEIYKPAGLREGVSFYTMGIWTRWGEKVFETTDPNDGWNGRKNNSGQELPVGVYMCVLQYRDARQRSFEIKEFVTLIR